MTGEKKLGVIFNIQHYSIHDGPGIRTTVFLKGCPLGCLWCQNPESQTLVPQLLWDEAKCSGCGICLKNCLEKAISLDQLKNLDPSLKVHLLPYHRLGESKYERLDRKYEVNTHPPEEGDINKLKEIIEACGLTAISGG